MTVSDQGGRVSLAADPGIYTLMARSFGFVSAIVPELQIPRAEPVRLQLRTERQVVSLLSDNAPLDIGWAFRPRVRDVLRYGEPSVADTATKPVDDAWIQSLDKIMAGNVNDKSVIAKVVRGYDMDGDGVLEESYLPVYDSSGNLTWARRPDGTALELYRYTPYGARTAFGTSPRTSAWSCSSWTNRSRT